MSLKGIAKETLNILEKGYFTDSAGNRIDFASEQKAAEEKTVLYTPSKLDKLLNQKTAKNSEIPVIQVTGETTQAAAYRLWNEEATHIVLLNHASARNPGGGFINGAKAQEEDLTRCSGLYPCLLKQPAYYEINRSNPSLLYTDHIIYAPKVPWFRVRNRDLLENFFLASVITTPAPNAGQELRRHPDAHQKIETALRKRAGYILSVAHDNGHRTLLLGAWGCGVFRNKPEMVADAFGQWLDSPRFYGCFDRVVFSIYDSSKAKQTHLAFQNRFKFS